MKAALITIGDEILSGNTVDTNSNFIAGELRRIGIPVVEILTVSDDIAAIEKALGRALSIAEVVVATGGLGPTKDDKTKSAFSQFFNKKIIQDAVTFEHLKHLLIRRNREHLLEINRGQAEVLEGATVFQNDHGTAPCQMIEKDGRYTFSLPGVPYEVKPIVKEKIIPFLKEKLSCQSIVTRIISVVDFPESLLSRHIEAWETALPEHISLSYLPIGNRVKLRLTATGDSEIALSKALDEQVELLKPLIRENVISWMGNDIQEVLAEMLRERQLTISVAESCTGGELQWLITSVPGTSAYFEGGLVAYSEKQKIKLLGVAADEITKNSVVSEQIAMAMAEGCQKLFGTDIALSTTGAAGPSSDQYNTEVGTVFYAIRIKDRVQSNRLFLPHLERKDFMNFVSQRVLQDLVAVLSEDLTIPKKQP